MATTDRTADFFKFMKDHFVGFSRDQPLTVFQDNTSSNYGVTAGNKIMAKGSVTIGDVIHQDGNISVIDIPVAPFHLWAADVVMVFSYSSQTHGEKWLYPGGIFVDNVWDNLHPGGTISLHLTFVPGGNGQLGVAVTVNPGNPDDPNNFIKGLVLGTGQQADQLINSFTGQNVVLE
jgi:hypothetical protein